MWEHWCAFSIRSCLISKPMNEQLYSSDTWKDRWQSLSRRRYFLPSQPEVWVGILAAQVKGKKIQEMGFREFS